MPNQWIKALEKFNKNEVSSSGKKKNAFYIPKRGTKDYAKVKSMMK
jgi:hypothetical protein